MDQKLWFSVMYQYKYFVVEKKGPVLLYLKNASVWGRVGEEAEKIQNWSRVVLDWVQ